MEESLAVKKHREWNGKIEVMPKAPVDTLEELSVAYTPGVAEACLKIKEDIKENNGRHCGFRHSLPLPRHTFP